jgi:hypothetical protein
MREERLFVKTVGWYVGGAFWRLWKDCAKLGLNF